MQDQIPPLSINEEIELLSNLPEDCFEFELAIESESTEQFEDHLTEEDETIEFERYLINREKKNRLASLSKQKLRAPKVKTKPLRYLVSNKMFEKALRNLTDEFLFHAHFD